MANLERRPATVEIDLDYLERQIRQHIVATSAALLNMEVGALPIEVELTVDKESVIATLDLVAYDNLGDIELVVLRAADSAEARWYVVRQRHNKDDLEAGQYYLSGPSTGRSVVIGSLAYDEPEQL